MKVPLSCRGPSTRRTVEGILDDHQTFLSAGGDLKKAKQFNNCMSEPFSKIPISPVHVHFSKQPKEYVNVLLPTIGLFARSPHHSGDLPENLHTFRGGLPSARLETSIQPLE